MVLYCGLAGYDVPCERHCTDLVNGDQKELEWVEANFWADYLFLFVGLSPSARKPKSMHQPMRLRRNSRKTFTNSFKLPSTKKEVQETLILVIGSIDTKVGSDNRNWEASMETHGEGVINENVPRLLCNKFACNWGNTLPHKRSHKFTGRSPDGTAENQIDHVAIYET